MTAVRDRSENYIISARSATAAATIEEKRQQFFAFAPPVPPQTQSTEQNVLGKTLKCSFKFAQNKNGKMKTNKFEQ